MTLPDPIVASVKRFRAGALCGVVVTAACLATGCGGVSGSKSVSPGTFFLPGLMQNDAPSIPQPSQPQPSELIPLPGPNPGPAATSLPS